MIDDKKAYFYTLTRMKLLIIDNIKITVREKKKYSNGFNGL
jgi:hypothetical protein